MKNAEHDFSLPPFPAFPSIKRYVALGPVLEATSRVARSVLAREAISLIIGPSGTGKSLACGLLAKQFAASHDVVGIGETTISDETSFYRFLLHRLGVAFESRGRDELELLVHKRLCGDDANPNGAVLVIDEAASLSAEVLEAIRRITNLMRDGQPAVSVVVAGGAKLDETLTSPALEAFVQRVAARCYLHPLSLDEARNYIRESIEACEASADETITEDAVSAIYHATGGVPRLINQLMTEAIDCAADMDQSLIDDRTVDRAWASLQQLPAPMIEDPSMKGESSIVEFGELLDPLPIDPMKVPVQEDSIARIKSEMAVAALARGQQEQNCESAAVTCGVDAALPAADPVKLFGDFEEEESIQVTAERTPSICNEACDTGLESMIHSQIIGLSHFAAEKTESRRVDAEAASIEAAQRFEADAAVDAASVAAEPGEAYPSVLWYDEPNVEADLAGANAAGQDDSDLLWITEDIDVDRRSEEIAPQPSMHRFDAAGETDAPKLNIDYREMLEKMRKQSSTQ